MNKTVKKHKKGAKVNVTSRYADYLVNAKLAELVEKEEKEEKAKPETKEEKPKAKVITKAVK